MEALKPNVERQAKAVEQLERENHELMLRLQKAEETIRSMQSGVIAQKQQERELHDTLLLQDVSAQLIHAQNSNALYQKILEAGVSLMRADKGTIQLFDPKTSHFQLIASQGVDQELHNAFTNVTLDSGTSCVIALATRKRAIVENFAEGEYRESRAGKVHRAAGVLAAQTTPLVTRSGELLGMMSTHWSKPCHHDAHSLRMIDILARQTADLMERNQAEESLRQSEKRLEMELADT